MKQDIQPNELQKLIASGEALQIVDVRERHEFFTGHIPSAINIPLSEIQEALAGIDSDDQVVIVCQGGVRSLTACERVKDEYPHLFNLVGGTSAWQSAGFEVETGP